MDPAEIEALIKYLKQMQVMNHPDVLMGQRFMGPWEGPSGSMDELYGMPRLYTEDKSQSGATMWDIAPKDI